VIRAGPNHDPAPRWLPARVVAARHHVPAALRAGRTPLSDDLRRINGEDFNGTSSTARRGHATPSSARATVRSSSSAPARGSSRKTGTGATTSRTRRPPATTQARPRTRRTPTWPTRGFLRLVRRVTPTGCCRTGSERSSMMTTAPGAASRDAAESFGVELFTEVRRARDVGEDDRDDLPRLTHTASVRLLCSAFSERSRFPRPAGQGMSTRRRAEDECPRHLREAGRGWE
jgi:hypothetical protein